MAQSAPGVGTVGTVGTPHGIMPTRQDAVTSHALQARWNGDNDGADASSGSAGSGAVQLSYQGGLAGTGVVTGAPRVYVVFWGTQWGTQTGTEVNGAQYPAFSGDPAGMAPDLEAFYAGLGTDGETWSGVLTQYCQSNATIKIRTGATTCPAGASRVAYPTGGALAGVWEDTRAAAPTSASEAQLGQEAEDAATHFGRTSESANRNVQYVIVSPTGTTPDGFNTPTGQFCAWHDYTTDDLGDLTTPNGAIAFTNMPYVPDAGYSCGANYINPGASGTLDGVTVIASHEYAETLTDPDVGYGWYNPDYGEAADICAWAPLNQNGGEDLTLATGVFPVQGVYGNDANAGSGGCELSHAILINHVISIANPGHQTSTLATPVRPVTIRASDRPNAPAGASGVTLTSAATLRYRAEGLPAGLVINPTTGVISGSPRHTTVRATVTILATDSSGNLGVTHFVWSVRNSLTIVHPDGEHSLRGHHAKLRIRAHDTHSRARLVFAVKGLPRGLKINRRSGVIAGAASGRRGTYRVVVTVTDSLGAHATTAFTWRIR